ncbi:MAG: uroporphyrinogen decarboxylase family protein [Armatimonadota bacterium]
MDSRMCVIAALRGEQPEWIPTFEWLFDAKVRRALYPGSDTLDIPNLAGWDAVVVYADDHPDTDGAAQYIDEWGLVTHRMTEEYPVVTGHRFDKANDLDGFVAPDPSAEWHFRSLREARHRYAGDKAIIFRLRDAYSLPRYLLGMENLMMSMVTDPELVRRVVDISVDYYIGMANAAAEIGVDAFWTSDDYCDNRGPVMGPELWRSFCLPGLTRLVSHTKSLGKPFIKHCDGNINPILDDLVGAEIDCIDPIDTHAGVDLAEIKSAVGDKIAIKGGVPVSLLCNGTPDEVRDKTRRCIEIAGPCGYILSSTSDITASVKPENYAAMIESLREYGGMR